MGFIQLLLIGVGLSMDAFAVSVCKGLKMKTVDKKYTVLIAAFFGGFQALMPLLGWLLPCANTQPQVILATQVPEKHLWPWRSQQS